MKKLLCFAMIAFTLIGLVAVSEFVSFPKRTSALETSWEIEQLPLNFLASDVMNGGVTVIAGSASGDGKVYKSVDEGQNWAHIWTHPYAAQNSLAIYFVYVNSKNTIFVAAGNGGLYRSSDVGNSFHKVVNNDVVGCYHEAITELSDGTMLLGLTDQVAAGRTIYRSADDGVTWTPIQTLSGKHIHYIKRDPATSNIYVNTEFEFYLSTDNGKSFQLMDIQGILYRDLRDIVSMGINFWKGYVYFGTDGGARCPGGGAFSCCSIYRFLDQGMLNPTAELVLGYPYGSVYNGLFRAIRTTPDNKFILVTNIVGDNMISSIHASETGDPNSWTRITEEPNPGIGRFYGFHDMSHRHSKNSWHFVSNTIAKKGIRIKCQTTASQLIGDINLDGKVDMEDTSIAAKAFGSYPGHERWNPIADITSKNYLVPDGTVDMYDIGLMAMHFGETKP